MPVGCLVPMSLSKIKLMAIAKLWGNTGPEIVSVRARFLKLWRAVPKVLRKRARCKSFV
ncbi:MAG: hypothetical protein QW495_03640 [Candidatus Hadarchaeum sp.]